ncbi:BOLA class I histocompatibility antigen, alpha chain BL3-7-like isoform X3 [Anomaloglossus baeobatrachus]|uniref:BOLA class I histocompatibility antigen, alpha chain BL3-7-like isoform X3 n=1 Tax=Anomaloglossus baeobatrachus TaxID=238106 RepID=UPI003F4F5FB2
MEKMLVLSLILLAVSRAYSDGHSLQFYYTGVSSPGSGLPEFSIVGYVDDREITNYNSDTGRIRPKVQWMEKVDDGYWERNTPMGKWFEASFRQDLKTLMSQFNQTRGLHVMQRMYGCERRDDGSITGYDQFGYDGGEYMVLDTQTGMYIPTMAQAQNITERINSPEVQQGKIMKYRLKNDCLEWLKVYVQFGREDLEKRDGHSLQFYYTGVSSPGSGLPEFSIVGYVDDREITNYNSDTGRIRPKVQWMEKVDDGYWERNTPMGKWFEASFRQDLKTLMSQFNQTRGLHVMQRMYGCERRDDGSITGYDQFGYDGGEYMVLDTQTGMYIPTMAQAQNITERINSPEVQQGKIMKYRLKNDCLEWLKVYVQFGREDLEKRVQPRVKVSGHEEGDTMKLHCQVYGFHPRAVDVRWMNGEDEVPLYETTNVLPNPDSTYQIRVSTEVTPKEGDNYSCYVDHSSLKEPLLVRWEPKQDFPLAVIISVVVVLIIVIVLTVFGVIIYKKKKSNFTLSRASDTSSVSDVSVTDSL